jgi:protein SCO1/2
MNTLGQFYKGLQKTHLQSLPQVVMVSLDPARDSSARLKSYVHGFDAHFLGARGDEAQVNQLTKELGVVHMKEVLKKDSKNYNIEHSGAVIIFNPQGQLAGFFTPPLKAPKMAEEYTKLVS